MPPRDGGSGGVSGRLGHGNIMQALGMDDVDACQRWIQDPRSHIEDTEASKHQTALVWCARKGSAKCMKLILNNNANVNATMIAGATALYVAAQQGHRDCMELLIKSGANVNTGADATTNAGANDVATDTAADDVSADADAAAESSADNAGALRHAVAFLAADAADPDPRPDERRGAGVPRQGGIRVRHGGHQRDLARAGE